jgi:hypothetical protein
VISKESVYLFIWNYIYKNLIPRKSGIGNSLKNYSERMIEQFNLANIFKNPINFAIVGDSSGEELSSYSNMSKLQKNFGLGVNIAISGTRADSWFDFLNYTSHGLLISNELKQVEKVIFSLGKDNILQRKIDSFENYMQMFHSMFPNSYVCIIEPIDIKFFTRLMDKIEEIEENIKLCNSIINKIWDDRVLDISQYLKN